MFLIVRGKYMMKKHWLCYLCLLCVSALVCGCGRVTPLAEPAVSLESFCSSSNGYLAIPTEFADLYADPHRYKGYALYNSYQILSGPIEKAGRLWYESYGWVDREVPSNFTLLEWVSDQDPPALQAGDIVFVLGTVDSSVVGTDERGENIPFANIQIHSIEKAAQETSLFTTAETRSLTNQTQTKGSLTIQLHEISFAEDGSTLTLESRDTGLLSSTTYYYDIIFHQDGYADWYSDCNIILFSGQSTSRDVISFSPFDSQKPLDIEIHVKDENGNRLYEPIFFHLDPA